MSPPPLFRKPDDRETAVAFYKQCVLDAEAAGGAEMVWEAQRALCRGDLYFLLVYALGRQDMVHDWIFARCREVEKAPNGHLDLWAREHGKSSIITIGKTIQDILNDPELTVGIFSFNRPIAKAFLRVIKREFEANVRLRGLFPDVLWENPHKQAPTWSEDGGIIVRRRGNPKESTVEAWGLVDGQPTSKHYDLMVYDDVVAAESVTTPEMIHKVTSAWEASRSLIKEGGASRYAGTRWHYADTYQTIMDRGAAIPRIHPATKDGTVEGTPVLWSRQTLRDKYREQGIYTFSCQNLLNPLADRKQGFLDAWLRYAEDHVSGEGMNKYLIVDAANEKKKTSDYTAMVIVGLGSDSNYYLLDAVRDRLSLRERGDAVFALHRRWKPRMVGYERYGIMGDVQYLKERMTEENYRFDITELGGRLAKADRIRRMVPIFEEGRFVLQPSLHKKDYEGKVVDLVRAFVDEEYRAFPLSTHDDMFDALSRICDEELTLVWPKDHVAEDRYAAPRARRRRYSAWAA